MKTIIKSAAMLCIAVGIAAISLCKASADVSFWLPPKATEILSGLASSHPQALSYAAAYEASLAEAEAVRGFFDASMSVAAGLSSGPENAPESGLSAYMPGDTLGLQSGVLIPLRSGAYIGAGIAQRRLDDTVNGLDGVGQTLAGARINVPLLRDRGFRAQLAREDAADVSAKRADANRIATLQALGRNVIAGYAEELYAAANLSEIEQALSRVRTLFDETSERVKLKTMPEYQVFPAEMEVTFKLDDVRQAEAALTNSHHALEHAAGGIKLQFAGSDGVTLRHWAHVCATTDVSRVIAAIGSERPEITAAKHAAAAAEAEVRRTAESTRSKLTLTAGIGYQAENTGGGFGNEAIIRDNKIGADAAIVWSRPLSFGSEEAALRAQRANAAALLKDLQRIVIDVDAEQMRANTLLTAAIERLDLVDRAVESAQKALAAESERMKLGEGRSRNVLDAQDDLTLANQRATLAAYNVVIAFTDALVANGVSLFADDNGVVEK